MNLHYQYALPAETFNTSLQEVKKIMFMLFIAMPESHNKTLTLIANIGDREHTYICYSP